MQPTGASGRPFAGLESCGMNQRIGQVLLSIAARNLSIPKAYSLVVAAGLDGTAIPTMPDNKVGMGSRAVMTPAILAAWGKLSPAAKERALPILGEGVLRANASEADEARHLLEQHGFRFANGHFVPINIVHERERPFLPPQTYEELTKAIGRLDGDESGAIAIACGAVDSLMTFLYDKYALGSPNAAFAAKVNTAIGHLQILHSTAAHPTFNARGSVIGRSSKERFV